MTVLINKFYIKVVIPNMDSDFLSTDSKSDWNFKFYEWGQTKEPHQKPQ